MSRWAEHSRAVIERTLAGLPKDADLADVRKALHAAYPFGERKMHPYKVWCAEQRKVLATFERGGRPNDEPHFTLMKSKKGGKCCWLLSIRCSWCRGTMRGGCLKCSSLHDEWGRLFGSMDFTALFAGLNEKPHDAFRLGVIGDWLEENRGHEQLVMLFREQWAMRGA